MKKLISILLSLISVICISFAFTGCEDKQAVEENKKLVEEINTLNNKYQQLSEDIKKLDTEYKQLLEENKKLDEENKKLDEENKSLVKENEYLIEENEKAAIDRVITVESGKLYMLREMYDNGLLKENDLKSIACAYYDVYKFEENPYSGLFDPHEELNEETANKIKKAYSTWISENIELPLESIEITNYYGTYNGNVAVRVDCKGLCIYPAPIPPKTYIGGVVFQNFWSMQIIVYHI